ncbi:predicted protein [Lichtheimia corymbifera JMRC:FSU:9682]|uniref:Uncharacterized protein n=1 Tax=Lichtheimia corymbifera JMRC:FSU:9682 TaxID=1263082 RepID=A0A068S607_9FUNG|nr:predicted protein [Lichtheimia corymbifera JMRC:FSU:9682]
MADPWRVHPTTTPVSLDTARSLVHSSATIKRNSIHSSSCYQQDLHSIVANSVHSLVTILQHTLSCTHHSAATKRNNCCYQQGLYSIVSNYLQQPA